jgi:dolichol-phosphate mannosyltransferase
LDQERHRNGSGLNGGADPATSTTPRRISVVLPVRDEPENIGPCLERLEQALGGDDYEVLVCYDSDEDTTLPAIESARVKPRRLILVRNQLGKGPSFAMRAGLARATGDVIVTTMADLCDPPEVIAKMAEKIREQHADVVSGSRYMPGGSQSGGPPLKSTLSRMAGVSLYWLSGMGTRDATTNFRAFSRRLLDAVEIESGPAFSLGLELTVKAQLLGFRVDEVPSSWVERHHGESRFRLGPWLPQYLRFYFQATRSPLLVWTSCLSSSAAALLRATPPAEVLTRTAFAAAAIVTARRLRGRTAAIDASLPLIVFAPIPKLIPGADLLRAVPLFVVLALAKQEGLKRPWTGQSPVV